MFHKTILTAAILLGACISIQISDVMQKQRSQLEWRQEATNTFSWNATQKLQWSVVNAFIDVQTSPDGDVYAIQSIESEMAAKKYFVYLYDISSNIWSLPDANFQAKAVRFDRLGNIYYLDQNNCILNSQKQKLICGSFDFEVTVNREIYLLHDGLGALTKDTLSTPWRSVGVEDYTYKALSGYKGITLLKDQPILIQSDGTVDSNYGGEKLVSISAGIDGSLWALKQEANVINYQILKWQTVAQKWYIVSGARGASLSAYNEISVAIVDEKGLLSLSSQVGHQDEAQYLGIVSTAHTSTAPTLQQITNVPSTTNIPATTDAPATTYVPATTEIPSTTVAPTTTDIPTTTVAPSTTDNPITVPPSTTDIPTTVPPTTNMPPAIVSTTPEVFPTIIGQPSDSFVTKITFKKFAQKVNETFGTNIKSFTQVFNSKQNTQVRDSAMDAILLKTNIFGFIKTDSGSILGFYYEGPIDTTSQFIGRIFTNTMIYGISSDHFSYKEFTDTFDTYFGPFFEGDLEMQVISTPRARLAFHPSCLNSGSPNTAECYSSSDFNQPEYCYWTLLKPEGSDAQFVCEQIEYYQGNLE